MHTAHLTSVDGITEFVDSRPAKDNCCCKTQLTRSKQKKASAAKGPLRPGGPSNLLELGMGRKVKMKVMLGRSLLLIDNCLILDPETFHYLPDHLRET